MGQRVKDQRSAVGGQRDDGRWTTALLGRWTSEEKRGQTRGRKSEIGKNESANRPFTICIMPSTQNLEPLNLEPS